MSATPADLGWLLSGVLLGAAFFLSLRLTTALYAGRRAALGVVTHILRLVVAGAAFWLAANAGLVPLLAVFAGFVLARLVVVRRVLRDPEVAP